MPRFNNRSGQRELLDRDDIPFEDIKRNMQELDRINHRLGGHRCTLHGMHQLTGENPAGEYNVVEIGCGGGDNLRTIRDWALKKNIRMNLTGIDIKPECIAFAENDHRNKGIRFICSDYRNARIPGTDIIFSSLFCHHFTDPELISMLRWMQQNSRRGFFINDLHRHRLAWYSIRFLTQVFSKSYLVKNDAPLSVQRGFRKKEWKQLMADAGINSYRVQWHWAFRWLIVYPCR